MRLPVFVVLAALSTASVLYRAVLLVDNQLDRK